MTTQKTFKRRVRARAAKTGEAYTAARSQLLRKADAAPVAPPPAPVASAEELAGMSDEAMLRGSGRPIGEWLEILDAWGATDRKHPEIARWLVAEHGIGGWWAQSVTVAYERARGMRAVHQQTGGFSVSATRTVAAPADRVLAAFTDPGLRDGWLPEAPMRRRRTTAANVARFDWDEPPSRVVVGLVPKQGARTQVAVAHEKLATAEDAARMKAAWRAWLGRLKQHLEG
jgi:uncharacterized protein YndB with AHSA1/START domain